jgi:hypothetical protein
LLDINVTKSVHSTLQQIDPARNLKKLKNRFTHDVLLLFCMFALKKDERKLQYSRGNVLGFINTGYFTSDNFPTKLLTEKKISSFFRKWLKQTRDYLIFNA